MQSPGNLDRPADGAQPPACIKHLKFAWLHNCLISLSSIDSWDECSPAAKGAGSFVPSQLKGRQDVSIPPAKHVAGARFPRRSRLLALALVLAGPDLAFAQGAAPATPEQAQQELTKRKNELEAAQSKAKALESSVADLDAEREALNGKLLETAALIQKSEGQLTSIEGRLTELEAQEKLLHGSLEQRHDQIAKLLGALQRMGRNPPPVLITRREDALKMVRSAMLLASAFPELKGEALSLAGRLDDLIRVMTDIRSEGDRLKAETARLTEARTRLAGLMEAKKFTLAERENELTSVKTATAEIAKSVGDLSDLITKLDQTVTEKTGLGSYQQELKKEAALKPEDTAVKPVAPLSVAPPPDGAPAAAPEQTPKEADAPALSPPPRLKPQIVELAPSGGTLIPGSAGRMKPSIAFVSAHGKLPYPAQGRRVLAFGERTQFGNASKGMVVETRTNAQVTSVCDGWVAFAGEFRSYGQLLIINAGDGYVVLLAGMSQIDVQPGQFVLAAEPVGTMGGGSKASQGPSNSPFLYVEFRKDGKPIDPDPWWVAGQQKVQG